nr:alpha-galactosidase [Lachnospiraceae bacterium]
MAVVYEKEKNLFRLLTKNSEYQIKVDDIGLVIHNYYGRPAGNTDLSYRILSVDRGFSGNPYETKEDRGRSVDVLPQEYSGSGVGDYRVSSIKVVAENGSQSCDLRYASHEILNEKPDILPLPSVRVYDDDVTTLKLTLEDRVIGLEADLYYSVFYDKDVITRRVSFRNVSDKNLKIEKAASGMLDLQFGSWDEIHFSGRHCMERGVNRNKITQDIKVIGSKRGMSSHHENPFVIICDHGANENSGDCYGLMLMYSGNHKFEIEKDQAGSTRVVAGINDEYFSWCLEAGNVFDTPELIMAY